MTTNKKFISLEGEERTLEEQVVFLTQTVRALTHCVEENTIAIDRFMERICYLETQL